MSAFELKNPVILALDVNDIGRARQSVASLKGRLGAIKVGPRLLMRYGPAIVRELSEYAPVFVDNKYFDIPSTMVSAVESTFEAGATLVTVHASAGREALRELAALESKYSAHSPVKILAVTILTSFSESGLPAGLRGQRVSDLVSALADDALESGISGLVCSGEEVQDLRQKSTDAFLVTPGIRLPENSSGDQKRVLTPQEAIRRGASALVIGRPLLESSQPSVTLDRILNSISEIR